MRPHPRLRRAVHYSALGLAGIPIAVWIASAFVCGWWNSASGERSLIVGEGQVFFRQGGTTRTRPMLSGFQRISPVDSLMARSFWWGPRFYAWGPPPGRTGRSWSISTPVWLLAVPALAALGITTGLRAVERRRGRAGACPGCGYDRRGLGVGVVCPECGEGPGASTKQAGRP